MEGCIGCCSSVQLQMSRRRRHRSDRREIVHGVVHIGSGHKVFPSGGAVSRSSRNFFLAILAYQQVI